MAWYLVKHKKKFTLPLFPQIIIFLFKFRIFYTYTILWIFNDAYENNY